MTENAKQVIRDMVENANKEARRANHDLEKRRALEDFSLPHECPVTPLGKCGDVYYYLDMDRQLRALPASKHVKNEISSLFDRDQALLYDYWPRMDEKGKVSGWRPELAAHGLMQAAADKGIIDFESRMRGPGCWRSVDGKLVMHCGDRVYIGGESFQPGVLDGCIYHAAPPTPHPLDGDDSGVGEEVLSLLKTWNWHRPDIDPTLLLGWIVAAVAGGALKWRPLVWLTGSRGTGKSTLQSVIDGLVGESGLVKASDATAAGIWQTVKDSSLPIALDEMEADEDNRRAMNVIKLARQAASGGVVLRGGSDHTQMSFTARSCFIFSSVLIPPLTSADISRMAILNLNPLEGQPAPVINNRRLAELGRRLRHRLMMQWHRFNATLEAYSAQLMSVGHSGRGADQFGTLLACADLLFADSVPDGDTLETWGKALARDTLAEAEDDVDDHERCIQHVLTSPIDVYRGGQKRQVGDWIAVAAGYVHGDDDPLEANKVLASYGLKVIWEDRTPWLAIANSHQGLASIFRETHWAAKSGSLSGWVQAVRRIPGAQRGTGLRFAGVPAKDTRVPITSILGEPEAVHKRLLP